MLESSKPS